MNAIANNKPSWSEAPEWAGYLAQSDEGDWFWFENQPEATPHGWGYNPNFPAGRVRMAGVATDWQDTLESRPNSITPALP